MLRVLWAKPSAFARRVKVSVPASLINTRTENPPFFPALTLVFMPLPSIYTVAFGSVTPRTVTLPPVNVVLSGSVISSRASGFS